MGSFDPALIAVAVSFARHLGASRENAEDIAQDALLKLITRAEEIEDPTAWLFVVIRRLTYRTRRREQQDLQGPSRFDPWNGIELDIDARRLLSRSIPRRRWALALFAAGYSGRESAAVMGCSAKAAEKALRLARQEIRRRLQPAESDR